MTSPLERSSSWQTQGKKVPDWQQVARDAGLDMSRLPRHVAIIMDGNGRWASQRHLPCQVGHRQGVEAVRQAVRAAKVLGLEALTIFGFSSENWRRPPDEVAALMGLLRLFIRSDLKELKNNNVRIKVLGSRAGLEPDIAAMIEQAERETSANRGLDLLVAFNYGGRDDIVRAARALAQDVAEGRLSPDQVSEEALSARLDTAGWHDPDLLIRTSGEQRISNFLIWQCAYTEFVFQDVLWPDFDGHHLISAIRAYQRRERRYGARPEAEAVAANDLPEGKEDACPAPALSKR